MKYLRITPENLFQFKRSLKELEENFLYPLGDDSFSIDHGENYLRFFDRMGRTHFYCAHLDGKVIAVGAGVIHHRYKVWYLCDMKVHPDHRGKKLTKKMFQRFFLPCYLKAQKGFALTMENNSGPQNPIMKIMERLPWTPLKTGTRLLFYYEDSASMHKVLEVLKDSRKGIHFSSLKGIKDLVLKSTGRPIPLLHMEWEDSGDAQKFETPQEGHLHMWCLMETHPHVEKLKELGIAPKATGLIFHHRMNGTNWNDLRTSEL